MLARRIYVTFREIARAQIDGLLFSRMLRDNIPPLLYMITLVELFGPICQMRNNWVRIFMLSENESVRLEKRRPFLEPTMLSAVYMGNLYAFSSPMWLYSTSCQIQINGSAKMGNANLGSLKLRYK